MQSILVWNGALLVFSVTEQMVLGVCAPYPLLMALGIRNQVIKEILL